MKTRKNQNRKKTNRTASKPASNWKSFTSSDWVFGSKAMSELKILVRLASKMNEEFNTNEWRRLSPKST